LVGGNVPDAFIADPETDDDDGTITIVVREALSTRSGCPPGDSAGGTRLRGRGG